MTRFGDGLGCSGDLLADAEQAVAGALAPLSGRRPDLVAVFVSGGRPDEAGDAAERVAQLASAGVLVGCTADGVIGGGRGVEGRGAVSVWAASLPGVHVRGFHLEVLPADGAAAVVGLPERDDAQVAVLLADPYSFPADGFVARSHDALPGLPVVGGLAAGLQGPGSTRLFLDGRTVDRGAVGVLLGGDLHARTVVSQGCRAVGPAMTVTRGRGNVVLELAGVPALDKVRELLAALPPGDQALASAGLQLGIAVDEYAEEHDFLVRGLLGAEAATGGLVVGDLVEVGRTVRLQVRDAQTADAELRRLLARLRADSGDLPGGGALLFSCNGRGSAMFGESYGGADHDVTLVRDALAMSGVGGFFAGGELGPVAGRNHLHGFTASLLAIQG